MINILKVNKNKSNNKKHNKSNNKKHNKSNNKKHNKSNNKKHNKSNKKKHNKSNKKKYIKRIKGGNNSEKKSNIENSNNICHDYVITGGHGFILHNNKEPNMIKIPENMRIIFYTDFCGKSCTNSKVIYEYICNINREKITQIPTNIVYKNSVIPEIYLIPDKFKMVVDDVKLQICNGDTIFLHNYIDDVNKNKAIRLSSIIKKLEEFLIETKQTNSLISLYYTLCLDVFDNNDYKIINKTEMDNITYSKLLNLEKHKLKLCNEKVLQIIKEDYDKNYDNCVILVDKNTLQITFTIMDKIYRLLLVYNISINKFFILPYLISLLSKYIHIFKTILLDYNNDNLDKTFLKSLESNINKYELSFDKSENISEQNKLKNNLDLKSNSSSNKFNITYNDKYPNIKYYYEPDNILNIKIDLSNIEIFDSLPYTVQKLKNLYIYFIQYALINIPSNIDKN